MNFEKIETIELPELQIYKNLRENAFMNDNSFIADSPKVVNEILQTSIEVKSILATQEYYDKFQSLVQNKNIHKIYVATKEQMQSIVGHTIHHNCMLHAIRPQPESLENLSDQIVMLDAITSTQNLGSIARSAAALGVNSLVVSKYSPHPYARRALRVSMGHISKLKYFIYDDILQTISLLQKNGYKVFGAEVNANSIPLQNIKIPKKWVVLLGHEGNGLAQEVIDACDQCVEIEMVEGVRSFNVGIAASILMYNFINKQ